MNREFVLRDNEVAINRPDGTVIIMNLNALRELQGDSDKSEDFADLRKELAEAEARLERYKEANEAAVRLANDRVKMINDLKEEVATWKIRHKHMSEDRNRLVAELEKARESSSDRVEELNKTLATVRKERDEYRADNARLSMAVCNKNAEIQKLQQKLDQYSKQHVVLFGPTALQFPITPDEMPDHVYITHTGEVFFSQRDVEKAYNLSKGSVSAYFNDKQTALYARDPWGNRITDKQTGKDVTIGLVRRPVQQIFKNRDINRPAFENYELAVKCAKDFVK